jgi:hypothetical protein
MHGTCHEAEVINVLSSDLLHDFSNSKAEKINLLQFDSIE